jgi:hypothetical protein
MIHPNYFSTKLCSLHKLPFSVNVCWFSIFGFPVLTFSILALSAGSILSVDTPVCSSPSSSFISTRRRQLNKMVSSETEWTIRLSNVSSNCSYCRRDSDTFSGVTTLPDIWSTQILCLLDNSASNGEAVQHQLWWQDDDKLWRMWHLSLSVPPNCPNTCLERLIKQSWCPCVLLLRQSSYIYFMHIQYEMETFQMTRQVQYVYLPSAQRPQN